MKIKRRWLILFLVAIFLMTAITVSAFTMRGTALNPSDEKSFSVLLCGLDEGGVNTDVMLVACVDFENSRLDVLQIPRDTLVLNEEGQSVKINSRFSSFRAKGMSGNQAARALKKEVSSLLGMNISGVVMPDMHTLSSLIDELGGVRVYVPKEISYTDPTQNVTVSIPAGEQLLNGQQALGFIRYRSGYARGDLGRIDAQKFFLTGLFARFRKGVDMSFVATMAKTLTSGKVYTDMNVLGALKVGQRFLTGCRGEIRMATLPGEALYTSGTWYFVAHRAAADALLSEQFTLFYKKQGFDYEKRLYDPKQINVKNAYEFPDRSYRIYSESNLKNLSF